VKPSRAAVAIRYRADAGGCVAGAGVLCGDAAGLLAPTSSVTPAPTIIPMIPLLT
jgi:hypothetical protein